MAAAAQGAASQVEKRMSRQQTLPYQEIELQLADFLPLAADGFMRILSDAGIGIRSIGLQIRQLLIRVGHETPAADAILSALERGTTATATGKPPVHFQPLDGFAGYRSDLWRAAPLLPSQPARDRAMARPRRGLTTSSLPDVLKRLAPARRAWQQ